MNYKHLHYFWTVLRAGGIVRASEQLHLTPQTLSGQIKLLEDRLGRRLFRKNGRNLELTDDGRVALRYADEIFSLGQELESSLLERGAGGSQVRELRVGLEDAVAKTVAYRLLEPALRLAPEARVGFIGVARDEETALPYEYMVSLPDDLSGQPVYLLDPMLATGGSMRHAIDVVAARGATDITAVCVVAAPEGVAAIAAAGRRVRLVVGAVDDGLDENHYIVPGLGDAGDRQFGPRYL